MKIFKDNKEISNIMLTTFITDILILIVAYFLIPIILDFPPFSLDRSFQLEVNAFTYNVVFSIFSMIFILFNAGTTAIFVKPLMNFQKELRRKDLNINDVQKIRVICMNSPLKIYKIQVLFPIIIALIIILFFKVPIILCIKVTALLEMLMISDGLYCFVMNKKYYDRIIIKTYNRMKDYVFEEQNTFSLKNSIFLQIFPLFVVAVLLTVFLGYTRVTNERGNSKYYYYYSKFPTEIINADNVNIELLKEKLGEVELQENDYFFIIDPEKNIYFSKENGYMSKFCETYIEKYYDQTNGKGYEFFSVDEQAFARQICTEDGKVWYVGFKYSTVNRKVLLFLILSFISLMLIYIIIIYMWAKSFGDNIKRVVRNLNDIIKENSVDFNNVIPITSVDEIGTLADTYNKLQNMLENQIELLENQAQLVTLGELAGNMAHDINTPMATLNNSISMIKSQLDKKEEIDPKELEMLIDIMISCTNKTQKIINSMRNQVRTLGNNDVVLFSLENAIEESIGLVNTDILSINTNVIFNCSKNITIKGEPSKFMQVITSLLLNSIQAYKSREIYGQNVEITATKYKKTVIIEIKDYAKGIPEAIQPFIFKNILTVNGTTGTGLGLYLAYSIIKGVFGGKIEFNSITGEGTTFRIELPL